MPMSAQERRGGGYKKLFDCGPCVKLRSLMRPDGETEVVERYKNIERKRQLRRSGKT